MDTCLAFGFGPESPRGVECDVVFGVAAEEKGLSPAAEVKPADVADDMDRRCRFGIDGNGGESSEIRCTFAEVKLEGSALDMVDFLVFRTAIEDAGRALRAEPGREIGVDLPLGVDLPFGVDRPLLAGVIVGAGEYPGELCVGRP